MYKIMYKAHGKTQFECLGSWTDLEVAVSEMDRLERSYLGSIGSFQIVREGHEMYEEPWKESVMQHFTRVE